MLDRWAPLTSSIGASLGHSAPQLITQDMVDRHAETTGDAQWIHNDPARATAESPFGGPIAQGFLLLALLTRHSAELTFPAFGPVSMLVNYGFDRVRFLRPVLVGESIWIEAALGELRPRDETSAVIRVDLELLGGERPTTRAVAQWLFLAVGP